MNNKTRRSAALVAALLCAIGGVSTTAAQGRPRSGLEIYEEQLRVRLDEQIPGRSDFGYRAGGWLSFAVMDYDDPTAGRDRTLRKLQLRGWLDVDYRGEHRLYVRGLANLDDWSGTDNPRSPSRGTDFDLMVERAWYQFDWGRFWLNRTGNQSPVEWKLKVGREFATIGTGLALATPLDMIELRARWQDWSLKALAGQTIYDSENLDRSPAVAGRQERCFYGVEVAYEGFDRHRPFVYYLMQNDHTTPEPRSATQGYDYSSRYVGIGSEGTILSPDLAYRVEVVGEWGRTYGSGAAASQDEICAWAADVMLEYTFRDTPTRPKLYVEYLFGSGDSDRASSSTSTLGGNTPGTRDRAFNAFGFRDTGIAFSPAVSNLHIWSAGGSCFPLENHKWFERMEVGSKAFLYCRAKDSGAISDTSLPATNNSSYVGWEMDVYVDWRITSDLSWTVRYGFFQPGDAYNGSDKTCRQFVYTGLVLSF